MLDHIYRIVSSFEKQHGIFPNLLYLNQAHSEQLKSCFSENYTFSNIIDLLDMDVIIETDIVHPHVAWAHSFNRAASF